MLSRLASSVPQPGQRERGDTTDSLRGTRWMTTFRNEPTARPRRALAAATKATMVRVTVRGTAGPAGPAVRLAVPPLGQGLRWDDLPLVVGDGAGVDVAFGGALAVADGAVAVDGDAEPRVGGAQRPDVQQVGRGGEGDLVVGRGAGHVGDRTL